MQAKDVNSGESKAQFDAEFNEHIENLKKRYETESRDWFFIKDMNGVSRGIHRDQLAEAVKSEQYTPVKGKNCSSAAQRRALTACK
jgi:hypothetical protein